MPLCRLLEMQGASTLRLPVMQIESTADRRALAARLGALDEFDLIVFSSANAVRFGAFLLDERRDLTLAAVGPATAHALNQAGYRVTVQPSSGFDSESLLSHPGLEHVCGSRVLIVKGCGGRELLEQELTRRGAAVATADVYRRVPATPGDSVLAALLERFVAGEVQVITASSAEIATHLLEVAPAELRDEFEKVHWLLPGERVAAALRARGLTAPLLLSHSARDQDFIEALIRWRSSASGA